MENLFIRNMYVLVFTLVVTLSMLGRDTPKFVMNIKSSDVPLPAPFTGQRVAVYCVCPVRPVTTADRPDVEMGLLSPLGRGNISNCEVMEGRVHTPALSLSLSL